MATDSIDVLAMAAQELLDNTVPEPQMLLENLTVFGALYFLQQTCDYVVRHISGVLLGDDDQDADDNAEVLRALEAIVLANGNVNGACLAVGLFDEN
jgi:hypothetical protein